MRRVVKLLGSVAAIFIFAAALLVGGWFVYSATTGATLVVFRTGSMTPTMPQGALNLGAALMVVQSPIGMGVLTLAAGLLTVWAFWPEPSAKAADEETKPETAAEETELLAIEPSTLRPHE